MTISGEMLIGGSEVRGRAGALRATNASTGVAMEPEFGAGSASDVDTACRLAHEAFDVFRSLKPEIRADLLERIADNLMDLGETLVERVMAESGLPRGRVEGERGRTANQMRLFASVLRSGRWQQVIIDEAQPERKPIPRPDLRVQRIGVGPVAVFGASNFPLAFSVAGGDTASALAAGCPVVAKSHPSHLGTSELAGRAIQAAAAASDLPGGVFSLLHGEGNTVGEAIVQHPFIRSVAFTGSRRGGLALSHIAAARTVPIPVFAEMSSVNPIFLLPTAIERRGENIAQGLANSVTLGTGQFCTKPGFVVGMRGMGWDRFEQWAVQSFQSKAASTMLNKDIHTAFCEGIAQRASDERLELLASGGGGETDAFQGQPALFRTNAAVFLRHPELAEELFGPSTIFVVCESPEQVLDVARSFEGQLTATMHLEQEDKEIARRLLPVLEQMAGRILINGFPTGVEVTHAMVHGGPFPATTDSRFTSVGSMAIERFLRPVCYQDVPAWLLPEAIQDTNPQHLERLLNGDREERR